MSPTTCRDCGKRFQIQPLLDLPMPTRCLECLIGMEAKLAVAEVRAASLSQELLAARDGRDTNRARAEAAEARCAELEALVREVSEGGVEFMDERVRYVAVQIDSETWAKVRALAGGGK